MKNIEPAEVNSFLKQMENSPLENYAIRGLTSSFIGGTNSGCVRLFEQTREQLGDVTPHSHRFDLLCFVLQGSVANKIYRETGTELEGDRYLRTTELCTGPGKYTLRNPTKNQYYISTTDSYYCGQWYSMNYLEIHSIRFGRHTRVLFFEGEPKTDETFILEPMDDSGVMSTFTTEEWMFRSRA